MVKSDKTYSNWMPLPNNTGVNIQLDKNKCFLYKQKAKDPFAFAWETESHIIL